MVLCKQHNILHINGLSTFSSLFFGGNSRIQVEVNVRNLVVPTVKS